MMGKADPGVAFGRYGAAQNTVAELPAIWDGVYEAKET